MFCTFQKPEVAWGGKGCDKEENTGQGFLFQEPEGRRGFHCVNSGENKALWAPSLADLPKCEQSHALSGSPHLLLRLGEGEYQPDSRMFLKPLEELEEGNGWPGHYLTGS